MDGPALALCDCGFGKKGQTSGLLCIRAVGIVNGVCPFEGRSWCGNEGYEVKGPVYGPIPV